MRLFSSEQVSKYHPDKYADQISDAILDALIFMDANCRVAVETMVKGTTVVLGGEITTTAKLAPGFFEEVAKRVGAKLKYQVDQVINLIGTQSPEINQAVSTGEHLKAGDQGMMFGFATADTPSRLPLGFELANRIIKAIENDVETNPGTILQGDAKTQVTVDQDYASNAGSVHKILVSACHKPGIDPDVLKTEIRRLITEGARFLIPNSCELIVNPAGPWTIGGPIADCGVTGRKIVCDQYGGYIPVGGGAFSGKDPTKVDRTAAYMARKVACDILDRFPGLRFCRVQVAYGIGRKYPLSLQIITSDPKLDELIAKQVQYADFTPANMIEKLRLREPIYEKLAEGCHFYGHKW